MRPGCTHALVGWKRSTAQLPFMQLVIADAAPSIPDPPDSTLEHDVAPCGIKMVMLPPGTFCSMCYEVVESGARLSDGEMLCMVCTCSVIEAGRTLEANPPPRLRIACFARFEPQSGLQLHEDLVGAESGSARELLLSLCRGEPLRFCGCIESNRVAGRVGSFAGYCTRRKLAVLRLQAEGEGQAEAWACVPMELVRRPTDELIARHDQMLRSLLQVGASASTLHHTISAVRAAHTLCGTPVLASAKRALEALALKQAGPADERQPRRACPGAPASTSTMPLLPSLSGGAGGRVCTGEAYPTANGLRSRDEQDQEDICHVQ